MDIQPNFTNRFLNQLQPPARGALLAGAMRRTVAAKSSLYEPGERVQYIYFPEHCLLGLAAPLASGDEINPTVRGADGGFGYMEAAGTGVMLARLVVYVAGTVVAVPATTFNRVHSQSSDLQHLVVAHAQLAAVEAAQSLACQALHPPSGRLGKLLLECADRLGRHSLPLSQECMADMIGVRRTTVTHAATKLKRLNLIHYVRGRVVIADAPGLRRYTCECYAYVREARRRILGFETVADPE